MIATGVEDTEEEGVFVFLGGGIACSEDAGEEWVRVEGEEQEEDATERWLWKDRQEVEGGRLEDQGGEL